MSEEVKEAIRLCNNVIENADYIEYKYMKEYKKSSIDILVKEIERLQSIIKEVREYIENDMKKYGGDIYITCKDILEILDKENKE